MYCSSRYFWCFQCHNFPTYILAFKNTKCILLTLTQLPWKKKKIPAAKSRFRTKPKNVLYMFIRNCSRCMILKRWEMTFQLVLYIINRESKIKLTCSFVAAGLFLAVISCDWVFQVLQELFVQQTLLNITHNLSIKRDCWTLLDCVYNRDCWTLHRLCNYNMSWCVLRKLLCMEWTVVYNRSCL